MLSRPEYENSSPDEPRSDLGGWYTGPSTSGDPSTSGGPSDVTDAPKTSLRRAKRVIPDEEKDDRYWAKRMRNNKAAKRSRENKRTMELEIRNRANQLEEQNALLTKELFVIKRQYGLPLDRSILSAEEQTQCIQDLKNSRAYLESQAFKMDQTENSTSPGMYPVSMAPMSHGDSSDLNGRCVPLTRSDGKLVIKEEPPESLCSDPGKFVQKGAPVYGQFGTAVLWGALHQPGTGLHKGYPSAGLAQQQTPQQPQQHPHLHVNSYGPEGSQGGQSKPLSVTIPPSSSTPSPCGHSGYNSPLTVVTDSPTVTVGTVNSVITPTNTTANNNNNSSCSSSSSSSSSGYYNDSRSPYDCFMSAAYPRSQTGYPASMLTPSSLPDLSALGRAGMLFRHGVVGKTVQKAELQEVMTLHGLPLGLDLGTSGHEGYGVMSGVATHAQINIASSFRSPYGNNTEGATKRGLGQAHMILAAHMEQTRKLAMNK